MKPPKQHSDCQELMRKEQLRENIPVPRRSGGENQYTKGEARDQLVEIGSETRYVHLMTPSE